LGGGGYREGGSSISTSATLCCLCAVAARPAQVNEAKPTVVCSAKHVAAAFSADQKRDFDAYAWPLGAGAFVTWSEDPNLWDPINHSCDPNTWLDGGLNTVARRAVKRGDELTIDYATFCVNSVRSPPLLARRPPFAPTRYQVFLLCGEAVGCDCPQVTWFSLCLVSGWLLSPRRLLTAPASPRSAAAA
jgi:hypothetical protein